MKQFITTHQQVLSSLLEEDTIGRDAELLSEAQGNLEHIHSAIGDLRKLWAGSSFLSADFINEVEGLIEGEE